MVLAKSLSEVYEMIDSMDWFHSIGKPIAEEKGFIPVPQFTVAVTMWKAPAFMEARSVAWEAFRREIVKDPDMLREWEKHFKICNDKIIYSLSSSKTALELVGSIHQEVREFCLGLPFVAAIGELFILEKHPTYTFNLSQLEYYRAGHWVCGWSGILHSDKFIYPRLQFYVY